MIPHKVYDKHLLLMGQPCNDAIIDNDVINVKLGSTLLGRM
jgi:hypothetical protein